MIKIYLLIALMAILGVEAERRYRKAVLRTVFHPSQVRTFKMPNSCKSRGKKFCFEKDNYPLDIVEDVLKNVTNLVPESIDFNTLGSYTRRQGEPSEYQCPSVSKDQAIYYIEDEHGRDRVVVQSEGRFQQQFSLKWCKHEGPLRSRTPAFTKNMVTAHKLYCRNKYMHYDFLVLSTEPGFDGKWKMEKARTKIGIPVCCMCRYDKVDG